MSPSRSTRPVGLLSTWKRWGLGEGDSTDESAITAAALAALNILGAVLSLLWLALSHPGGPQGLRLAAATFAFCAVGTLLIAGPWPSPRWMLQATIAVDTLLTRLALVATGPPTSVSAFYSLWAVRSLVSLFS